MMDVVTQAPLTEESAKLWAAIRADGGRPTEEVEPCLKMACNGLRSKRGQSFVYGVARPLVDTNEEFVSPMIE